MNSHGHSSKTSGAFGKDGRNGHNREERKFDHLWFQAVGVYYANLGFLPEELPAIADHIKLGSKNTVFFTRLGRENGKLTATLKAKEAMEQGQYELPKPLDFRFRAREQRMEDDLAAQVLVTKNGRNLPMKYRDDKTGLAVYEGLHNLVGVKCHGLDMCFRLWEISFVDGSKTAYSIGVESIYHELAMPGALRGWFCRKTDTLPSLEEVEAIIERHMDDMVEAARRNNNARDLERALAKREGFTPFIPAMAVAFLIAKGKRISMQDVPNRETKPAPRTETKPDLRVEAPVQVDERKAAVGSAFKPTELAATAIEPDETPTEAALQATGTDNEVAEAQQIAAEQAAALKPQSRKKAATTKKGKRK